MPREPPVTIASLPSSTRGALPVRFVEADLDDMAGLDMIEVLESRKLKFGEKTM